MILQFFLAWQHNSKVKMHQILHCIALEDQAIYDNLIGYFLEFGYFGLSNVKLVQQGSSNPSAHLQYVHDCAVAIAM